MPEASTIVHRGVALTVRRCRRIQRWIDANPSSSRVALARQVCQWFGWTLPNGELAERSARRLLQRLHDRGEIRLPPPRRACRPRSKTTSSRPCGPPPAPVPWPEETPRRLADSPLLVRPILPSERPAWQALLAQHHYLGFRPLVGEWLGYAAFFDGELVAVAAWAAASLKNRPRDEWIGWDEPTKTRRLSFVVNNARFLVLPTGRDIPHLASRVLGAMLRRLSRDWQATYRHPVYLAETFVDEQRFQGTCYRAANWQRLGTSRGFSRRGHSYQAHGHPKAVWVYPLRPDARERLRAPWPPTPVIPKEAPVHPCEFDVERLPLVGEDGLLDLLQTIPEVRARRGLRHPLVTVLALTVLALLCGHSSFEAIAQFAARLSPEFRKRLGARRPEPPSEPTFRRVLSRLPADEVDAVISEWLARQSLRLGCAIAVDGKSLRGSRDGSSPPVHLLSALLHRQGVVVAQTRVPAETNEIPCFQSLLESLPLDGAMVTADALHTQHDTARFLVQDKNADYLFLAKDNQPQLRQDIELLNLTAFPPSAPDCR